MSISIFLERNINWILRWMIIVGSLVRFQFSPPITEDDTVFVLFYIVLIFYSLLLTLIDLNSQLHLDNISLNGNLLYRYRLEALFDIFFFSILYQLTGDPNSDFYLFYFLPLLFAAEKLNFKWAFVIFLIASFSVTFIIFNISTNISTEEILLRIVFPRVVFFFFTSFIAATRSLHLRERDYRRQEIRIVTNKISKAVTQQELYQIIADESQRIFNAVGTHLRIEKNSILKIVASCGEYGDLVSEKDSVIPKDSQDLETVTSFVKAFVLDKPVIVSNAKSDQHFKSLYESLEPGKKYEFASKIKGFGCFPLHIDDRVIGVLTIRTSVNNYFNRNLEEDVQILMQNAAIAVRNLSSRDELLHATWSINHPTNLETRLEAIVESASSILSGTGGKIYLLNKEKNKLTLAAIKGVAGLNAPNVNDTLELDEGMVAQVIKTGEPQITDDYQSYQYAKDEFRELFKAVIEIPLRDSARNIIGAIAVINNNDSRIAYTAETDVPILEKFGEQASLAIANMQLLEREQFIHQLSNKITSTFNISEITSYTLNSLKDIIYFDSASIHLKHGNYLDILDCFGFEDPEKIKQLRFEVTEDIPNARVIKTMQHRICNNVADEYPDVIEVVGMKYTKHWLGVPLIANDEIIGMITFDRKLSHLPFTKEEVITTLPFADHIAIALKNVELYRISEAYSQTIQVLYDVNQVAVGKFDLQNSLQRMAELAFKLVQKEGHIEEGYSHITLVRGQTIFYLATYPNIYFDLLKENGLEHINWQENRQRYGITTRVCKSRKSEYVNDVSADPDFIPLLVDDKSQISVPIVLGDTLLGVVSVLSPSKGFFTDNDITLLEFLAQNAAAVIKLSRLAGANIGLTAFTIPIMHRLHENRKHIELARGFLDQRAPSSANIDSALQELAEIQLDFSKLPLSIVFDMEPTDLIPLMKTLLYNHERSSNIPRENKIIFPSSNYRVMCNPKWLTYSINIILDNAVDSMENRLINERFIAIRFEPENDGVEIQIENNGQRFRYEVLLNVFRKPIPSTEDYNRVSVGALVASQIIEMYNGILDVKSTTDRATIISIWLPIVNE